MRRRRRKLVEPRRCEWCSEVLPSQRYRLRICPDCRKNSIEAYKQTQLVEKMIESSVQKELTAVSPELQEMKIKG